MVNEAAALLNRPVTQVTPAALSSRRLQLQHRAQNLLIHKLNGVAPLGYIFNFFALIYLVD